MLFSLSLFAQEEDVKRVEEEISRSGDEIELLVLEEDAPLSKEKTKGYQPNTNLWITLKNLAKDTGGVLVAPAGWKKEDWLKASAVVAGVLILTTQDEQIKKFSQSIRTPTTNYISHNIFEKLGDGTIALPALGLTYAASLMIKNGKMQNASLTALESATITAVITTLGKHIFHRTRPIKSDDSTQWDIGNFQSPNLSFPSGHTGTAFAIATVFAEAYKDSTIIPILAYSAATLAGLSRIHDNKHWASDVAMGAALGYAVGKFVSNRRLGKSGIQVMPSYTFGPQGGVNVGVTIPIRSRKKN